MQKILESTSSDKLLSAMDANMIAFWAAYGRADGRIWHETSDVAWFYTGIPEAIFNGVLYANLNPNGVDATVDSLQAQIDEQGVPASWWIGPRAKPDNLGSLLEQHGLQPVGDAPGMAIDLASLDNNPQVITDFSIEKVSNAEMQTIWIQILNEGMGFSEIITREVARLADSLTVPLYELQHLYLGFLDGIPVATSALLLDSGVAGIYAVATLPEARRRGIGKSMTVVPLIEAKQMGYHVGILQSSSMGHPVYQKIGFKDVCKYEIYLQS